MHQTTFLDRPQNALARRTDPQTSKDAAKSVRNQSVLQRAILALLGGGGMTDEEIYCRLPGGMHVTPSGVRGRRAELVDAELVRDSDRRGRTAAGRECVIWERVP